MKFRCENEARFGYFPKEPFVKKTYFPEKADVRYTLAGCSRMRVGEGSSQKKEMEKIMKIVLKTSKNRSRKRDVKNIKTSSKKHPKKEVKMKNKIIKNRVEKKMEKKIRTSGCAVGTVYGDIMDDFSSINLDKKTKIKTSWIYTISKKVNTRPSLYLKAGALHGCVLCKNDSPLIYVEDVGRHNAVDKIAGWMFLNKIKGHDKIFYTTGRLTSEMVIKTVQMKIPILISRSGFTESGVSLSKDANLTLIGRMKGKRFFVLSGENRVIIDD